MACSSKESSPPGAASGYVGVRGCGGSSVASTERPSCSRSSSSMSAGLSEGPMSSAGTSTSAGDPEDVGNVGVLWCSSVSWELWHWQAANRANRRCPCGEGDCELEGEGEVEEEVREEVEEEVGEWDGPATRG